MIYRDLIPLLQTRADRLGLIDVQTGRSDPDELGRYMAVAVTYFREKYDLDEFITIDRALFQTQVSEESYALPNGFGRLLTPENRDYGGITLSATDGTNQRPMEYKPPAVFNDTFDTSETGEPVEFTITGRWMRLSPTPDDEYLVGGTYVERNTFALDDLMPMMLESPLVTRTLTILAADMGRVNQLLALEYQDALSVLANGQARRKIQFQRRTPERRRR